MAIDSSASARRRQRLDAAFRNEERRAQATAARVLGAALIVIAAWVTWENPIPAVFFYYGFIAAFFLVATAPVLIRPERLPPWERYLRFALCVGLYTFLVLNPNPFDKSDVRTGPMLLRWQNELYFFAFIAAAAFTYSPRVVLFTGFSAAVAWTVGAVWIAQRPETIGNAFPAALSVEEARLLLMNPQRIFVNGVVRADLLFLIVSALIAAFVRRSRRIVVRQAEIERQRANLSRYFSPNVVDELAEADVPLSTTRKQEVAVLFVDIVGFTTMSERQPPEAVIETLRQFHQRVERAVFNHGGTLEKYIGDGAMATFGTPRPGRSDAGNALRSTHELRESLAAWNAERARQNLPPIRAGLGAHYGPVVLGDIGGDQHLEFAVVGDTVNVASRLERLTRELEVSAVLSGELIDAVRREGADPAALLPGLHEVPSQPVRGRDQSIRLWVVEGPDSTSRPATP